MAAANHDGRCSTGAVLAPVFLRAALAVTFIWAGLGKLIPQMPVDPGQASVLASMGIALPAAGTSSIASPAGNAPADAPARPLPPQDPQHTTPKPGPDSPIAPTPSERAVRPDSAPAAPTGAQEPGPATSAAAGSASDVRVRRLWGLALRINSSAHPAPDAAGKPRMKLWPAVLGDGNWPRYLAIAVLIAELGGGVLVAFGFLTRLGAAMLVGVMLGAIWLDQLGPAIQSGQTVLLVLPAHDAWDVAAWRPLLWQFSLLCSAFALMLLGAGAPSLDRALGWMKGRGDDDDL